MLKNVMPPEPGRDMLQNVASAVVFARWEEGWSRKQLAEECGLSERFIADVERGLANPSIESLSALAKALDLRVPDMLAGEVKLLPRLGRLLNGRTRHEQEQIADLVETRFGETEPSRRVALVGMRGSGKTTVGKQLAKRLGCAFIELDRVIEDSSGLTLTQIFELHGEAHYRRIELEALRKVIREQPEAVIATGGGLVSNEETYGLLRARCRTVWLKAKPEEYLARVLRQGDRRPMERHPQALLQLKALLTAREPNYRRAEVTIDTTTLAPEIVVRKVATWLGRSARGEGAQREA